MFELKPLLAKAISAAQEKAVRYRVLNEPWEAESMNKGSFILRIAPQFCTSGGISNKKSGLVLEWARFTPAPLGSNPTDSRERYKSCFSGENY